MKLAYLDLPGEGVPAVVLHREATPPERDAEVVRATGVVGRTVTPFGDYAYYPSGMAIGGICWYRLLPGYAGTDPISLAKAVVQVCDLLDTTAMERPLLAGFGQGAVVALGVGSLRSGRVRAVVAVDPHPAHLGLLPEAVWESPEPPPILPGVLGPGGPSGAGGVARAARRTGPARYQLVLGRRRGRGGRRSRPGRGRPKLAVRGAAEVRRPRRKALLTARRVGWRIPVPWRAQGGR